MQIRVVKYVLGVALVVCAPSFAGAQNYPSKPIRLVVPFDAGGTVDTLARVVTAQITKQSGVRFIVDNRPGANSAIGSAAVARAAPDGYTVLNVSPSLVLNALLSKDVPYDLQKDFVPVTNIGVGQGYLLVVRQELPVNSVNELTALAKKRGDKRLTYGTPGIGNALHVASEIFAMKAATPLLHVPYKGSAPALAAIAAGEVDLMMLSPPTVFPYVQSGRVRPIAFTDTISSFMLRELDLRLEAGGADEMRAINAKTGFFEIPKVDWERTGRRVLTISWINGTPLTAPGVLGRPGLDRVRLANDLTQGFLSSAIEHGVFHADMHEGNAILTPEGRIALVDFGIIGRIGPMERRFLAEILWGFLKRDYIRIAEVHFEAGYVPPTQSVGDFAQALRSIGEPLFGRPAEEVSMGRVLLQLFEYTHTFGMALRPELVLLQKTMVQVEGVARAIDPAHNIWNASEPVIEAWMRRNFGPEGAARMISENVRAVTNRLKRLPEVMDRFEKSLEAEPAPPPATKAPFAPWWGWFGLIGVLGVAAAWAARSF
jgi:ubiquinone biosynthesis protein